MSALQAVQPSTSAPTGLDADSKAFLALPRFNRSLDFQIPSQAGVSTVTYAMTEPPLPDAPTIVFWNGLGAHRIAAAFLDGFLTEKGVRLLTIDKPYAGGSAVNEKVPVASRTKWAFAALTSVLDHHNITSFSLVSHSNGMIYTLYTLLNLPERFTVRSWTLTGPFVPPSLSGAIGLSMATMLPSGLTGSFGSLLSTGSNVFLPLANAVGWSSGLFTSTSASKEQDKEAQKPQNERGFGNRSISKSCADAMMKVALDGAKVSIGQETLLCLHGGSDGSWGFGQGSTDGEVLTSAFEQLAGLFPPGGDRALKISVFYGKDDGMVPSKGRIWLKSLLERVGLLSEDAYWAEVPNQGHDDVLFRQTVWETAIYGHLGSR